MKNKSKLHYRWEDDNLVVKRDGGKKLSFPKAMAAYHKNGEIIVISSLGKKVRVDRYGNRRWW